MTLRRFNLRNADGQTFTEYAFVLVLTVLVIMAILPLLGSGVLRLFNTFANAFGG